MALRTQERTPQAGGELPEPHELASHHPGPIIKWRINRAAKEDTVFFAVDVSTGNIIKVGEGSFGKAYVSSATKPDEFKQEITTRCFESDIKPEERRNYAVVALRGKRSSPDGLVFIDTFVGTSTPDAKERRETIAKAAEILRDKFGINGDKQIELPANPFPELMADRGKLTLNGFLMKAAGKTG
jgi:hypothetical protein